MREGEKKESRIKGTKGVVKIFLPFNASFTPLFVGDVKNGRSLVKKTWDRLWSTGVALTLYSLPLSGSKLT